MPGRKRACKSYQTVHSDILIRSESTMRWFSTSLRLSQIHSHPELFLVSSPLITFYNNPPPHKDYLDKLTARQRTSPCPPHHQPQPQTHPPGHFRPPQAQHSHSQAKQNSIPKESATGHPTSPTRTTSEHRNLQSQCWREFWRWGWRGCFFLEI